MPRRNRTFSSADVIRIIDEHLSAVEKAEVIFELRFGPMRRMVAGGVGLSEEDMRQLNDFVKRLQRLRGGR